MFLKKQSVTLLVSVALSALIIGAWAVLVNSRGEFPEVSSFNSCNVDNISGAVKSEEGWVTQVGTNLLIQGWSADKERQSIAKQAVVQVMDLKKKVMETKISSYDTDRPDVSSSFNNPALSKSGFNIQLDGVYETGTYLIQLGSIAEDINQICATTFRLVIVD